MDFAQLNYALVMPFYIHLLRKKKDEGSDIIRQLKESKSKSDLVGLLLALSVPALVP